MAKLSPERWGNNQQKIKKMSERLRYISNLVS